MFTPLESTFGGSKPLNGEQSLRSELRLQSIERIVSINRDAFTIGSSKQCDLSIEDGSLPTLHSVIHMQNGAIWIEAADDTTKVTVNDRPYRRMALRHDDRLKLGKEEFRILMNAEPIANTGSATLQEDLSLLSAEELCDRIIAEQSMVADFVSGQRSGWDALLRAIEEADTESLPEVAHAAHIHRANPGNSADFKNAFPSRLCPFAPSRLLLLPTRISSPPWRKSKTTSEASHPNNSSHPPLPVH